MYLREIKSDELHHLAGTSYGELSCEMQNEMLTKSQAREHQGRYFCLLLIWDGEEVIGVINLYGHREGEISIGPEMKMKYRGMGYATKAMELALMYAARQGFTRAASEVRKDNLASLTLHKKLGFRITREYVNRRGKPVVWVERGIQPRVELKGEN